MHPTTRALGICLLLVPALCLPGGEARGTHGPAPGALVHLSMQSTVGVLLDELPASMRDRVAADLLLEGADHWIARAERQVKLTDYRLVFRHFFYDDGRRQLPLPPETVWHVTLDPAGPARQIQGGHDAVVIAYDFHAVLVSDPASTAESEPALAAIGGQWTEPFLLPLDPELLFQRTGYACMNEEDFPPHSVDSESAAYFYDQECDVELPGAYACHTATTSPSESCEQALEAHTGKVVTQVQFTRLPWSPAVAAASRVGQVTTPDQPDLTPLEERLAENRIIYRYIAADDCAVVEGCVGAPGWRRLLQFDAAVHNVGGAPIHVGDVDHYLTGVESQNDIHHVFDYSACHGHLHFDHYGDFTLGSGAQQLGEKKAFCLISTERFSNNESTPLGTDYASCDYQGIEAGWGDVYQAGLDCQWIDITPIDTSAGAVTEPLTFVSNPDQFLCEGTLLTDALGDPLWEATSFTTEDGDPVDKMQCDFAPGSLDNNVASHDVVVPQRGGLVTAPCAMPEVGPLRNCAFIAGQVRACTPGQPVPLRCMVAQPARPQVLRICEASQVLGEGVDCVLGDALANVTVAGVTDVDFTCPGPRDAAEPGGTFAVYTGPVYLPDGSQPVWCMPR